MNLYKRKIYKKSLQHGLKWRNHKYLYIDANGNYVYPEDVKNKATGALNNAKSGLQKFGSDMKKSYEAGKAVGTQYAKDRKFVKDPNNIGQAPGVKRNDQLLSAHRGILEKDYGPGDTAIRPGATGISSVRLRDKRKHAREEYQNNSYKKSQETEYQKQSNEFNRKSTQVATPAHNKAKIDTYLRKQKKTIDDQRKSAHAGYEEDKRLFPEGGSTEELERQKKKTAARKTKARTDATVEEMRKRKKRMDASVEPVKPTRNISGVKPGGKTPVKETPTSEKKRRSIDRDDLRTYKKAAGMMLNEGQQNEINKRKERSERVKAGNAKMRKEINAENAKKVGKALLSGSKFSKMAMAGRSISKAASERKAERQANEKQKEAEFNRKVKADQAESNAKMKEASKTTAKNMAKNKGMQEVAKTVGKDVAKEVYNETYKELPEGYTIKADGYIYDDIGAVVRKATADDYKKKKVSKR